MKMRALERGRGKGNMRVCKCMFVCVCVCVETEKGGRYSSVCNRPIGYFAVFVLVTVVLYTCIYIFHVVCSDVPH